MSDESNRSGANLVPLLPTRRILTSAAERAHALELATFAEGGDTQGWTLIDYWRIAYKHKWVILSAIAVALAVGLAATLFTRPIYTAHATIEIDRQTTNVVGLQGVQPVEEQDAQDQEFFETQYGLLKSRSLAERVAQALNLANDEGFLAMMAAHTPAANAAHPPAAGPARMKWAVNILQNNLQIAPIPNSRLVDVLYDSPSPDFSARIANAFADNFISSNLERHFEASAYARKFLEQRLAQLKTKLEESERQVVAYATKQHIIQVSGPTQNKDEQPSPSLAANNLQAFDSALTQAKAHLIDTEEHWRAAEATQGLGVPEIIGDPTIGALRQQKVALLAQYEDQLKIYKPDYPQMLQLKARMDDIDQQIQAAADTIRASLKTQYETALQQETALQAKVDQLTSSVLDLSNREIKFHILQREVDTNRTLYEGLLQRYKEIGVSGGVTVNNVSIVDRAEAPGGPSQPRPLRNMMVAGVVGLGLGALLAFLLEAMDQAIRKPSDIEERLGLTVLGSIPLLEKGVQPAEALADARSPFSEAYHAIRSTLHFSTEEGVPRTLAVTSARPGEGKTTTVAALAQGFARAGMKVLVMDLDLRNPGLHKLLGADNRVGAGNLLTGTSLQDVVQSTKWPNLFVVPSGPLPPSPAELLAGSRLKAMIKEVNEEFDILIMDAPPVVGLADAPLIASAATGTLIAIEVGQTTRAQARGAIRRLRMTQAHVLGAVFTKLDTRKTQYGYGYAYAYNYDYDYSYGRKRAARKGEAQLLGKDGDMRKPTAA